MRIAIDATPLSLSWFPKGGMYWYVFNLVVSLMKIAPEHHYLLFFHFVKGKHLSRFREVCTQLAAAGNFQPVLCRFPPQLTRGLRLPVELFLGKIDLFHEPVDYLPAVRCGGSVVTIHDMAVFRQPQALPRAVPAFGRKQFPRSVRRADAIITVSQFSKRQIVECLHVPAEKVQVIYHGVSARFAPVYDAARIAGVKARYGIKGNYVLFVGTLQPNKNLPSLLQAFRRLQTTMGLSHQLVIAGTKGWLYEEIFQITRELELTEAVVFTGFVDEDDLPVLYSGADLFILPSLLEGFGIPVVEAMRCGTPVVAARAGALPEIVGDAALLVDPGAIDALTEGMWRVLRDPHFAQTLVAKGLQRAQAFTWERAARETLAVYQDVYQQRCRGR